jgi:phosphoglycolate phosphatase|tara:strand:- start:1255 stop:1869 length:615 start_codon:yes stop_codon:yes gene_type:complete
MSKFIIFDLDGVLINSKKNMNTSWTHVNRKLKLNVSFKKYFSLTGIPFENILEKLNIKKKLFRNAKRIFREQSIKHFNQIKIYSNVYTTLDYLKNVKKYKLAILTSKEKSRTIKILKLLNLKFDFIQCPIKGFRGKPDQYLFKKLIKKAKQKRRNCFYVGDTFTDYKFAKNSKIKFIFCNYGYGKKIGKNIKKINNIKEIVNYI